MVFIKFAVTLSPPLPEYEVLDCNCSMCRKSGYLLVCTPPLLPHHCKISGKLIDGTDPERKDVKWHGESQSRCAVYRFNTKLKDQLFCPKCGTSLAIDFKNWGRKFDGFGVSVSLQLSVVFVWVWGWLMDYRYGRSTALTWTR